MYFFPIHLYMQSYMIPNILLSTR